MKTIIIIINPNDVQKAKVHLDTLTNGHYILPNLYKMEAEACELTSVLNSIEYLLSGVDFCLTDEYYLYQYN
jgi:nitrogen regulatory protein PII